MSKNLKKPPTSQVIATGDSQSQKHFNEKPLSSTAKNSKWSINIQEIVKRTQKNLDKGLPSSSQTINCANPIGITGLNSSTSKVQKTQLYAKFEARKPSAGSNPVYLDLKKKWAYDSLQNEGNSAPAQGKNDAFGGFSSAKSMRPSSAVDRFASLSLKQIPSSSADVNGGQSNLQARIGIVRQKLDDRQIEQTYNAQSNQLFSHQRNSNQTASVNDGSLQGNQGGDINEGLRNFGQRIGQRTLESETGPRLLTHPEDSHFLMQEDQEAQILMANGPLLSNQNQKTLDKFNTGLLGSLASANSHGMRSSLVARGENMKASVKNSNIILGSSANRNVRKNQNQEKQSAIKERIRQQQDFFNGQGKLRSGPIVETIDEEQTNRGKNTNEISKSLERNQANISQLSGTIEEAGISTTLRDGKSQIYGQVMDHYHNDEYFNQNEYNPDSRSFAPQNTKNYSAANGRNSFTEVEQRQKIFEEEIIKRVKELQRYVKTLHLQLKKTQGTHKQIKEEMESDKDILLDIQRTLDHQQKRQNQEKLKFITFQDQEQKLREHEDSMSEQVVQIVSEAVEGILLQVKDEMIPNSKLQLYDSITEESNRVKIEIQQELKDLKREIYAQDATIKSHIDKQHQKEALILKQEIKTEQSAQSLQVYQQVETQIANAIKQLKSNDTKVQVQALKTELKKELQQMLNDHESQYLEKTKTIQDQMQEQEQKIQDLQETTIMQLNKKFGSLQNSYVTIEHFGEKLNSLKKTVTDDAKNQITSLDLVTQSNLKQKIEELTDLWQADIKNHVESSLRQFKQESVQDRAQQKQDTKKEMEKAVEKIKSDTIYLKEQIVLQQELNRDTALKIEKASSANDILQNYNDLPDQISNIQVNISQLKLKLNDKNDNNQHDLLAKQFENLKQKLNQIELKVQKLITSEAVNLSQTKPSIDLQQFEQHRDRVLSVLDNLSLSVDTMGARLDEASKQESQNQERLTILEKKTEKQNVTCTQKFSSITSENQKAEKNYFGLEQKLQMSFNSQNDQFEKQKNQIEQNFANLDSVINNIKEKLETQTVQKHVLDQIKATIDLKAKIDSADKERIGNAEKAIEQLKFECSQLQTEVSTKTFSLPNSTNVAQSSGQLEALKRDLKFEFTNQVTQAGLEQIKKLNQVEQQLSEQLDEVKKDMLECKEDLQKAEKQKLIQNQKHDVLKNELEKVKNSADGLSQAFKALENKLISEQPQSLRQLAQQISLEFDQKLQEEFEQIRRQMEQQLSNLAPRPQERASEIYQQREVATYEENIFAAPPSFQEPQNEEEITVHKKYTASASTKVGKKILIYESPNKSFNKVIKDSFKAREETSEFLKQESPKIKINDQDSSLSRDNSQEQSEFLQNEPALNLQPMENEVSQLKSPKECAPNSNFQEQQEYQSSTTEKDQCDVLEKHDQTAESPVLKNQLKSKDQPQKLNGRANQPQNEDDQFNPKTSKIRQSAEQSRLSSQFPSEHQLQDTVEISNALLGEQESQSRQVKEGSQLLRTQKIAGLGAISSHTTQQQLNEDFDGMDEIEEGEGGLEHYLDGLDNNSKLQYADDNILQGFQEASDANFQEDGFQDASDANFQEDGFQDASDANFQEDAFQEASEANFQEDNGSLLDSQNKDVGNFLQKFELKASKKTGLLGLASQNGEMFGRFAERFDGSSEYEDKSNAEIDSILDSGKFCNGDNEELSPYRDLHSRNPSGIANQFVDKFDKLQINGVLNRKQKGHMLSNHMSCESIDQIKSSVESVDVGQASLAVLNMNFGKKKKRQKENFDDFNEVEKESILRGLTLQSVDSQSLLNSQMEAEFTIQGENDPLIVQLVKVLVEKELIDALSIHQKIKNL